MSLSCKGTSDCLCGCCSGISRQTPHNKNNLPGLPAIAYRTGTWATFKQSMLARLSSADYPALAGLKTRDDDDFSIALLDATSVMLDILTFYQERMANESYLRTAVQLQSLTELARLIGYHPAPGVGASVYLSFTLQAAIGLPTDPSTAAITIPKGTQVQSVPTQGQTPQTFETSADILAKADWNELAVQTGVTWAAQTGDKAIYLQGTTTQLQPGDAILVVGDERLQDSSSPRWDLRLVTEVETDSIKNRTHVMWSEGLGDAAAGVDPASSNPKFYALRQKAALFGYNAINPLVLTSKIRTQLGGLLSGNEWTFGTSSADGTNLADESLVDLDAVYSKLAVGGWLALIHPDSNTSRSPSGFVTLYLIDSVTSISRSDYGMSGKITRVATDTAANLSEYYDDTRSTSGLTQSEELAVTEQPLSFPLYGAFLDLTEVRPDLIGVQAIAVYGKSQKLSVNVAAAPLKFEPDDGSGYLTLQPNDIVTILQPVHLPLNSDGSIPDWSTFTEKLNLRVLDSGGRTGTLWAAVADFTLVSASDKDATIQEYALVSSVTIVTQDYPRTRIHLKSELLNCYDRTKTTVNANVGLATQGMSVSEILGSGAAATPSQMFSLKQVPLTFIQSPTPTGRLTTLQVTANAVAWKEVSNLYQQKPSVQVFATLNQPGGHTDVLFGDGVEGSTLPTGQNNIQANYRIGSGLSGNVGAGSITTLVDRPLGVSGVDNPQDATGAQDPQSTDGIRANAPLSVLTLGRAVSITDYQNFARSFAGIAKAYAIWIPSGPGRGVFITVAAAGGSALPPGNPTLNNLIASLHSYGNPLIPIHVQSFLETLFSLSVDVKCDPAYDAEAVKADVRQQLRQSYSFGARTFGQGVSADEVDAFVQTVPGVIAVNVTKLKAGPTSAAGDLSSGSWSVSAYNDWLSQRVTLTRPFSSSPTRICPYLPLANPDKLPDAAEILVLDPKPKKIVVEVMA
ncbi:MAG: putative baseplate assembly protein [Nitrospira sp. LK70]|nr:putative baseplate assembly protein [Nitrospira sp. LK70]